jgi:hypothetical protein
MLALGPGERRRASEVSSNLGEKSGGDAELSPILAHQIGQ